MEISKGIIAEDLFLFLPKYNAFIISDIHIGYEETLHKSGILIPKFNFQDLKLRLEKAFSRIHAKQYIIKNIVINGDFLHSFSKISRDEKYVLQQMIKFLKGYGTLYVIKGNHDKVLEFLLGDVKFSDELVYGSILITHGDVINKHAKDKGIKAIIIGHEHPSIELVSGMRTEKFKCFLKGKYKGKELIVTPSSNILVEGSDILTEKMQSPYIKKILDFKVFIVEDKIYDFGKAGRLK